MQPFIVRLTDLRPGSTQLEWSIGKEFFETFGNAEILDAALSVKANLTNRGLTVAIACRVEGSVTVACDRCLEDLRLPLEVSFEESYSPEGTELDFSQDVYDYVCTALPMQRVHPEGECDSETVKYLSK